MDPLAVLDVGAALDGHHVAQSDSEVVPHDSVHPDLVVGHGVVGEDNADTLFPLLTYTGK